MQIEMVAIEKITLHARSPRRTKRVVAMAVSCVNELGYLLPIVVDSDMVVIVGHARLLAAKKLKMKTVPVHVAVGMTEPQKAAYRLADHCTYVEPLDDEFDGDLPQPARRTARK